MLVNDFVVVCCCGWLLFFFFLLLLFEWFTFYHIYIYMCLCV